ncbi:MAG: SAM-dependent chlorinase/fluorinase [Pseudomonadota bacterium]
MTKRLCFLLVLVFMSLPAAGQSSDRAILVLLSDFGLTEHYVATMKGVAYSVDGSLQVQDLTHNIEPFDIWQASYQLKSTMSFWPEGTVFVAVVDPGVGTNRKSIVGRTGRGHYVVAPDNGIFTLIADAHGLDAIREIDENLNRLPGSEDAHTFHGRDVYVFTGARLAAGVISFAQVGPELESPVVRIPYQKPTRSSSDVIVGNVAHVEQPFGNIVTNVSAEMITGWELEPGVDTQIYVEVLRSDKVIFSRPLPFVPSFGYVDDDEPLIYVDSAGIMGLAINNGHFANVFNIYAGSSWSVRLTRMGSS